MIACRRDRLAISPHDTTRLHLCRLALLSFHAAAAEVERVTRGNLAIEGIPRSRRR